MLIKLTNTLNSIVRRVLSIVKDGLKMWLPFENSGSDSSGNSNNATLYTGKALSFDGTGDSYYVDFGNTGVGLKTLAFWINLDSTTEKVLQLTSTQSIEVSSGTITLNGTWTGSAIYVDATATSTISASNWKRVVITTTSAITVNDLELGRIGSSYGDFILSDLQIFDSVWTQADVTFDYENPQHLVTDRAASTIALSNLKGYWHLSEGAGAINYDSSGEDNDGTISGATWSLRQSTIPQLGLMDWSKGSNLVAYSEDFSYSSWLANNSSKQSGFTSPTGLSTAYKITASANNGYIRWTGAININPPYTVSVSIFAKKGTTTELKIIEQSHIGTQTTFDLNSGSIDTGGSTTSSSIEDYGDGWYRCSITQTYTGASTSVVWAFVLPTAGNLFLWGAQFEAGSSTSAYRRTNGSTIVDGTLIADPNDQSKDILDNTVRLREHSLNLDGSGYAKVDSDSSLDITNYSIDGWFYSTNNSDTWETILIKHTQNNFQIFIQNSNLKYYSEFASGGSGTKILASVSLNAWTYFCITESGGTLKCYINDDSTPKFNGTVTQKFNTSGHIYIGSKSTGGDYSNALIDDIRVYNGVLSADEVAQNYKAGLNQHKTGSSFSDDFSSDYGF